MITCIFYDMSDIISIIICSCGCSGGVMIYFDRVEVVNVLSASAGWPQNSILAFVQGGPKNRLFLSVDNFATAEMHANQLLDSAKPEHVELSDGSAAKKTDDGYQGKRWPCWLILSADDQCCYFHDRVENWVKSMCFLSNSANLMCSDHLCKLRKEYLNALTVSHASITFFLDKIQKLLTYHTPSARQLSQSYQLSKTVRVYLAHPVCRTQFKAASGFL